MHILSSKQVEHGRKREEDVWREKIAGLRRIHESLESKIHLAKKDLTIEQQVEVEKFQEFMAGIQKKRAESLTEIETLRQKIESMQSIIDNVQMRSDGLDEKEYLLDQRERTLSERERFLLISESKLNHVDVHRA